MKLKPILKALTLSFVMISCAKDDVAKSPEVLKTPTNEVDKYSYALGYDVGNNFLKSLVDDSVNINLDYIYRGISDGLKEAQDSTTLLLSKAEMDEAMKDLQAKMQAMAEARMKKEQEKYEERAKTAFEDGQKFLEANKQKTDVKVERSGMQYRVITEGKGEMPKLTDVIRFHIVGKFIDGEEFQSTRKMDFPPELPLNQINIAGIQEAFSKMPVGSTWEVVLPYQLAYGEADTGIIPPKSTIVFELELLEIVQQQ
jgi:FKBP-type peptidyl-prolyl cis-trans isomerase